MQQPSTLEPVCRVLFAMLAYAAHTVAPNTNKLRHLPLSKYGQMHTLGLASLFRDFVFANVLTILKMLFLARCCCHQAPPAPVDRATQIGNRGSMCSDTEDALEPA